MYMNIARTHTTHDQNYRLPALSTSMFKYFFVFFERQKTRPFYFFLMLKTVRGVAVEGVISERTNELLF